MTFTDLLSSTVKTSTNLVIKTTVEDILQQLDDKGVVSFRGYQASEHDYNLYLTTIALDGDAHAFLETVKGFEECLPYNVLKMFSAKTLKSYQDKQEKYANFSGSDVLTTVENYFLAVKYFTKLDADFVNKCYELATKLEEGWQAKSEKRAALEKRIAILEGANA